MQSLGFLRAPHQIEYLSISEADNEFA